MDIQNINRGVPEERNHAPKPVRGDLSAITNNTGEKEQQQQQQQQQQ